MGCGARGLRQAVQASDGVNSAEPADEIIPPGLGKRLAANEGWGAVPGDSANFGVAFHSGFGGGFGGGAFGRVPTKEDEARLTLEEEQLRAARQETAEAQEAASRAIAHVDTERQAVDMLRTER